MTTILLAIAATVLSLVIVAFVVSRRRASAGILSTKIRNAVQFVGGPFSLSIALHVVLLLSLIVAIHTQSGREKLIMVDLEAGGGGGGGDTENLDTPEVPMPEMAAPQTEELPTAAVVNTEAVEQANAYVREVSSGGIGVNFGGGMGPGYLQGIGHGFGWFIGKLRRKGLDVVLVIDGTGSMKDVISDVKTKMERLVTAIHQLVPIARIGVVVYGGKGEAMQVQPLTMSTGKLQSFLNGVKAGGGGEWEEDMLGACNTAIDKMDFKPYAKKVIVLVGDSPPEKADFAPLLDLIRKFKGENGTFNTVDVTAEEHERFERQMAWQLHHEKLQKISPLPAFAKQTEAAFRTLASTGDGSMKSLTMDAQINQQVLILAFGDEWQAQVAAFGRGITQSASSQ
jgi:von Willebrand factor type A domain